MKFSDLFKSKTPKDVIAELGNEIAEIPCELKNGATAKIVIRGFDSHYTNTAPTKNLFVRRYKLNLRFEEPAQADAFLHKANAPQEAKELNGDINLGLIPGESEIVALTVGNLSERLQKDGVTVDPMALYNAMMEDRSLHQDKYGKPASRDIIKGRGL